MPYTDGQLAAIEVLIHREMRRYRWAQYTMGVVTGFVGGLVGFFIGFHL